MILPTFRCCVCGSADVLAVAPGDAAVECDLFTVRREVPMQAWCEEHHPVLAHAAQEARGA